MKIVVLGGSPKGSVSVTMQYVKYIEKKRENHEYEYFYPAKSIKAILKDENMLNEMLKTIEKADIVVWAFPVYYMCVHGSYMRFIELCYKHKEIFTGKYAAAISTSLNFYDHTAHNYIQHVSEDLGMSFLTSHSARMEDLLDLEGQEHVLKFADYIFNAAEQKLSVAASVPVPEYREWKYTPGECNRLIETDKKIVVLTDSEEGNTGFMIRSFIQNFKENIEIVNLDSMNVSGHCLGCLRCGEKNICAYDRKDQYVEIYKNKIMTADILVWAGDIKTRFLSWKWKQFFDRSFFKTHQHYLQNKQFVFLISGLFEQNHNVKEILEAFVEMERGHTAAFISDEYRDSSILDKQIQNAASIAIHAAESGFVKHRTFRGVAGFKIFRDDIYSNLKHIFRADNRSYKRFKYYDFPNKGIFTKIKSGFMYFLTGLPAVRKRMYKDMAQLMVFRFKRIIEKK